MLDVLKFVEVIISILLTFVVLVQNKSVSLNLANMSGGMATITKRWAEKIIHNTTIVLGTLFVLNSLLLFLLK